MSSPAPEPPSATDPTEQPGASHGTTEPLEAPRDRRPALRAVQLVLFEIGVVVPLITFAFAWHSPPQGGDWQSGNVSDIVAFLLCGKTYYLLLPLLCYAIAAYTLLLFQPARFGRSFVARIGLASGVVLALHFSVAHAIVFSGAAKLTDLHIWTSWLTLTAVWGLGSNLALIGAAYLIHRLAVMLRKVPPDDPRRPLAGARLVATCLATQLVAWALVFARQATPVAWVEPLLGIASFVVFWQVVFAPYCVLSCYAWLTYRVGRQQGGWWRAFSLRAGLGAISWFVTYLALARQSIVEALELYAELPTEPHGCYIATAAARGHPSWVRSWQAINGQGKWVTWNVQLLRLKTGELLLQRLAPPVHRVLRRGYDRWAPAVARRLTNPWLADAVYMLLKPLEYTLLLLAELAGCGIRTRIHAIRLRHAARARTVLETPAGGAWRANLVCVPRPADLGHRDGTKGHHGDDLD